MNKHISKKSITIIVLSLIFALLLFFLVFINLSSFSSSFASSSDYAEETSLAQEESSKEEIPILSETAAPKEITFPFGLICDTDAEEIDISAIKHSQIAETCSLLSQMQNLRLVHLTPASQDNSVSAEVESIKTSTDLSDNTMDKTDSAQVGESLTWADISMIQDACGTADVDYQFEFMGDTYSTLDETFDLSHLQMTDNGEAVKEILPCMRKCKVLDMDFCGVDDEHMEEIREAYPEIDVIWRIWFGENCSVRTDTERILASNLDHNLTDENSTALKYCTKVKYLDIGHQHIKDVSFLSGMTDLEVCVLSISPVTDLSPIANCKKLEYLEFAETNVYDLSPLASLTNLHHLAMTHLSGTCPIEHWEVLQNLTNLERLWIGQSSKRNIPEDELTLLKASLPNTEINISDPTIVCGWRYDMVNGGKAQRYALLCEQFDYKNYATSCSNSKNDPKYNAKHTFHQNES